MPAPAATPRGWTGPEAFPACAAERFSVGGALTAMVERHGLGGQDRAGRREQSPADAVRVKNQGGAALQGERHQLFQHLAAEAGRGSGPHIGPAVLAPFELEFAGLAAGSE